MIRNLIIFVLAIAPALSGVVNNQTQQFRHSLLEQDDISSRIKRHTGCGKYHWQCADGPCIPIHAKCNGVFDCADLSDEDHELCSNSTSGNCVLPPYPSNGQYDVRDRPFDKPGKRFDNVISVTVKCDHGYAVDGEATKLVPCTQETDLSKYIPICKRYCELIPHRSVIFNCETKVDEGIVRKPCGTTVFLDTLVVPRCNEPIYRGFPLYMHCTEDGWNRLTRCEPECGKVDTHKLNVTIDGKHVMQGEVPWHAAIYSKKFDPYEQICGGTLISTTLVLTAAHCVSTPAGGKQPAEDYAVAVGKVFRPWVDTHGEQAQYSNVSEIYIPEQFCGAETNYEQDIAIVVLDTEVEYKSYIRPVCLNFNPVYIKRQLLDGKLGRFVGWEKAIVNGSELEVLKAVQLPLVTYEQCYNEAPTWFQEFVTSDKICAGFQNGTGLLDGFEGGGLTVRNDVGRYYLQGIASIVPDDNYICDPYQRIPLTYFNAQERFFNQSIFSASACVLPVYPPNGHYEVIENPKNKPGDRFINSVTITVSCNPGYATYESNTKAVPCIPDADLYTYVPKCKRYCNLTSHHSIDYYCETRHGRTVVKELCGPRVFAGTTVLPSCRPNYRGLPSYMHCTENDWDVISTCEEDCGRTTPDGQEYVIDGKRAEVGQIPWHAGIYDKTFKPYKQICGGSLVSVSIVLTAAHCFWKDGEGNQPARDYAVALGKIYRTWGDTRDRVAQFSNVTAIHIPDQFRGITTNYQNDVAVVVLEKEIQYMPFIRPVCISFDYDFNKRQLQVGNLGKIAGWGLTSAEGAKAKVLQVVEMPFVTYDQCFNESPEDFREYITSDKICAGFRNGTALCQGDSGGGLAFPDLDHDIRRYYIRGIVSTAPSNVQKCDPFQRTSFTHLYLHGDFLKEHLGL